MCSLFGHSWLAGWRAGSAEHERENAPLILLPPRRAAPPPQRRSSKRNLKALTLSFSSVMLFSFLSA